MPALGPFSAQQRLTKLDGRTREARLAQSTRGSLMQHLGHPASATEEMLIERCVQLSVRIALMDRRFAERREMTEAETNTYLSWSAHLSRLLSQLGLQGPKQKPKDLSDVIREIEAKKLQHPASAA